MDDVIHALIDFSRINTHCWLRTTEKSLNGHQTYFRVREREQDWVEENQKGEVPKVNEETAHAQWLSLFTNISQCFDQCSTKIMKDLYNNKKWILNEWHHIPPCKCHKATVGLFYPHYNTLWMNDNIITNLSFSITDSTAGRTETNIRLW